jgi:hypothetical protein
LARQTGWPILILRVKKARLRGGPKDQGELEFQIAAEAASRIGARIFADAQKTLLSTNTQLVLPCWLSSTGWPPFSVVTRALWQAVTAKQNSAAATNSLLRVVVMIWSSLKRIVLGSLYVGGAAARQELLRVVGV